MLNEQVEAMCGCSKIPKPIAHKPSTLPMVAVVVVFCLLAGHPSLVNGQTPEPPRPAARFVHAIVPYLDDPFLSLYGIFLPDRVKLDLILGFSYMHDPWTVEWPVNREIDFEPVAWHFQFRPAVSVSLRSWADLALVVPFAVQSGTATEEEDGIQAPSGLHFLPPELHVRVPFLHKRWKGLAVGVVGSGSIPTGAENEFLGDIRRRGSADLVLDWESGRFRAVVNAGAVFRADSDAGWNMDSGTSQWGFRPGVAYQLPLGPVTIGIAIEGAFGDFIGEPVGPDTGGYRLFLASISLMPRNAWRGGFSAIAGGGGRAAGDGTSLGVPAYHLDARLGYSVRWISGLADLQPGDVSIEYKGCAGYPVYRFRCDGCPDGLPLTWDFGDGAMPVQGSEPEYAYEAPGTYNVLLRCGETVLADATVEVIDRIDVPLRITSLECSPSRPQSRICQSDEMEWECEFSSNAKQIDRVVWDWGDGVLSGGERGTHVYREAGQFQPTVSIISCGRTASLTLDENLLVDCCDCKRFKVSEIKYPIDCPRPKDEAVPESYVNDPECPAWTVRARYQIASRDRDMVLEKLSYPNSRFLIVAYADECYRGTKELADRYNYVLTQRRAGAIIDMIEDALGNDLEGILVTSAAMGRLCADPQCSCDDPESTFCTNDRKVEIYIDFENESVFKCPNGLGEVEIEDVAGPHQLR